MDIILKAQVCVSMSEDIGLVLPKRKDCSAVQSQDTLGRPQERDGSTYIVSVRGMELSVSISAQCSVESR